jgi:hypothetical protein
MEQGEVAVGRNLLEFTVGSSHPPLSDHDKSILDFGKKWFKTPGARMEAVLSEFGMSETSYFQRLNSLRSHPEAREYAPDVLGRADRVVELGRQRHE